MLLIINHFYLFSRIICQTLVRTIISTSNRGLTTLLLVTSDTSDAYSL
jgi:hypothetical protein